MDGTKPNNYEMNRDYKTFDLAQNAILKTVQDCVQKLSQTLMVEARSSCLRI